MPEFEAINSRTYWDRRFELDWDQRGGPDQSRFFAGIMLEWMSPRLRQEITEEAWSICDWGCAEGDGTAALAAAFPRSRISGMDLAPAAIRKASQRYPAITFRTGDVDGLADPVDVIVTSNVLEHLEDPWGSLARLAPLARRVVIVLVPFLDSTGDPEHVHVFRPIEVRERLDAETYLTEAAVIDTLSMPQTRWSGLQLLAVYRRVPGAAKDPNIRAAATELAAIQKLQLAVEHGGLGPVWTWPTACRGLTTSRLTEHYWELAERNRELTESRQELIERNREFAQHSKNLDESNRELTGRYEELAERSRELTERYKELAKRNRELTESHQELAKCNCELTESHQELAKRNCELTESHQELAKRNCELTESHQELAKRNEDLLRRGQELDRDLAAREGCVVGLQSEITGLTATLREGEVRRQQLETLVDALHQSTSWRITKPLRGAARVLRGTVHLVRGPTPATAPANPEPEAQPPPQLPLAPVDILAEVPAGALPVIPGTVPAPPPIVAMLVQNFEVGGLERFLVDISLALGRVGLPCTIFAAGRLGRLAEEAVRSGISVHVCRDAAAVTCLAGVLGIRLVVAHHCTLGWEELHAAGIPIVEVLQNLYHWHRGDTTLRVLRGRVARFVAVSRAVRDFSVENLGLPPAKVLRLTNGVDASGFLRPRPGALLALRRQAEFVFLMPAQFWAAKCHHTVLTAFERLNREFPDTRLVFAGAVGDADVHARLLQRIEDCGLGAVVECAGDLDRRGLSHRYARANALLLPSLLEGFSLATIEGLYFGLPMILTDIGGAREVIEDEDVGILIPPPCTPAELTPEHSRVLGASDDAGHAMALLAAMRRMVADRPLWETKGMDGTVKFPTFDMDVVAARFEAALAPLLATAMSDEAR